MKKEMEEKSREFAKKGNASDYPFESMPEGFGAD